MPRAGRAALVVLLVLLFPRAGATRDLRGHAEVRGVFYPALHVTEARMRLLGRYDTAIDDRWFVVASACLDGVTRSDNRGAAAIARPLENYLERRTARFEVRLGMSNVAWGVLDELSPQDVVNPIDVSRFVLEGRSEARLPVPLARVRVFLPASLTLEGLVVPYARRGTFDQLDENRSPFAPDLLAALPRSESVVSADTMEGGVRLRGTGAGVDWGVSMYRDTVDFDRYELTATGLSARRPTRWMAGGDIETARGDWVFRGDGAFFIDDPLQAAGEVPGIVPLLTFQGGIGADRRVGENTLFLSSLYSHFPEDPRIDGRDEVALVGGFARDLSMGTTTLRLFGVWNATAESGFGRAIWDQELVENLRFEASAGVFLGQGGRLLKLVEDSDFITARLRFYF